MNSKNNFRHNTPARQRIVVTVKGHPAEEGPLMFKVIGPNKSVQLRRATTMPTTILAEFRKGALEVKAYAYVTHGGRYHLIELVAPHEGVEPSSPGPQPSALPLS